ncbi:MAG: YqjK-like family protein [Thiobacillus sp.]|uniref:YqjK-like family protein n=1 Tax=Thiobacillus sp. TaxID=924 RepID=UPI0027352345|nr:YqjK-like family protein [Thiobacillus sp.]MDP3586217.1 YqjK-like family protein [Thiobacillus sp.]
MNGKLAQLADRRRQLVAQAAFQRAALVQDMVPWRARLALVDQGVAAIRYLRRRPFLILGVALLFAAVRPRGAGKWLRRGWLAWQIGRRLR